MEAQKNFFEKSKIVHLIMRLTAHQLKTKVFDIYDEWGWELYEHFPHAFDALKLCLTEPEFVFDKVTIPEEHKKVLMMNIKKKLAAKPIKLRTIFRLLCFSFDGVQAIKESLLAAREQVSDEQMQVTFQIEVSPEYKAEVVTLDKKAGIERLNKAAMIVATEMKARGGIFKLVQAPTKIGSNRGEFDTDQILSKAKEIAAEHLEEEKEAGVTDSDEEDNEEGMDLDEDDGMLVLEEDADTNSTAISEKE